MEGIFKNFKFQQYVSDYKIIVFDALYADRAMFSGNSFSAKKLYFLYDRDICHYNVITKRKAAITKNYVSNVCDTLYDNTHKCDKVCSLWIATPPCTKDQSKYRGSGNRYFS
jgi:hypothetical protein